MATSASTTPTPRAESPAEVVNGGEDVRARPEAEYDSRTKDGLGRALGTGPRAGSDGPSQWFSLPVVSGLSAPGERLGTPVEPSARGGRGEGLGHATCAGYGAAAANGAGP